MDCCLLYLCLSAGSALQQPHIPRAKARKAIGIKRRERIVRDRTVTPALICLDYRPCSGVEEVVGDQGDRLGLYLLLFSPFGSFFVFASILPEFSVFRPFCILACNFLQCFILVFPSFSTFLYFFLSCCYVVIQLNLFCLYLLHIHSFPCLFPTYAGFVTPCFGHSFGFLHLLTITLCGIPVLDSTNHSDQLFPLLAQSAHPHFTKTKF